MVVYTVYIQIYTNTYKIRAYIYIHTPVYLYIQGPWAPAVFHFLGAISPHKSLVSCDLPLSRGPIMVFGVKSRMILKRIYRV